LRESQEIFFSKFHIVETQKLRPDLYFVHAAVVAFEAMRSRWWRHPDSASPPQPGRFASRLSRSFGSGKPENRPQINHPPVGRW
jgi:hypothetical protein